MKIRIVAPMPDDCQMSKSTKQSIDRLIRERNDIEFKVIEAKGSQIWVNRNHGAQHNPDYDYCLQVDNRKIFTVNDFDKLLKMNAQVASGWYTLPRNEGIATSYFDYDEYENVVSCFDLEPENKIINAPFFGTGFHLVKTEVYKQMDTAGIKEYYYPPLRKGIHCSEDIGFCDNLKYINIVPKINKAVFIQREQLPYLKEGCVKAFVIKFSDAQEIIVDGKTQKEVDILIIGQLLRLFGNKCGDFTKYFTIKETIDSLENLSGNEINLDKDQIESIREGFKLSAGMPQRMIWDQHENGLYKQLHKPEERDV